MSAQNNGSSEKRKNDACKSRQNKEIRLGPPEEAITTTSIIKLNNDCLVFIFKMLNINDLLSVADASKSFKEAVDWVYVKKFKHKDIVIKSTIPLQNRCIEIKDHLINIFDLKNCLKMLRCFGHLFFEVVIYYNDGNRRHHNEVDRYLNKYCAHNLHCIVMYNSQLWTMEYIEKPFKNLFSIAFYSCHLNKNLSNFNQWFPDLHALKLNGENVFNDHKSIEKHFPKICCLSIDVNRSDKSTINILNIAKVMHLNPQIDVVRFGGDILDAKFLHSIGDHLQNITHLEVNWNQECFNYSHIIHFQHVKKLDVKFYKLANAAENIPMPKIPFSFDRLAELELQIMTYYLTDDFMNFISKQTFLNKFTLTSSFIHTPFRNAADKLKLAKSVRLLKEIKFEMCNFTLHEILDFVQNGESVKKWSFSVTDQDVMYERLLVANLCNEWHIKKLYSRIELQHLKIG